MANKKRKRKPLDEYRRAAICAAHLGDWKKAATFLEEGAEENPKD